MYVMEVVELAPAHRGRVRGPEIVAGRHKTAMWSEEGAELGNESLLVLQVSSAYLHNIWYSSRGTTRALRA